MKVYLHSESDVWINLHPRLVMYSKKNIFLNMFRRVDYNHCYHQSKIEDMGNVEELEDGIGGMRLGTRK
jgi:hypothetical protein